MFGVEEYKMTPRAAIIKESGGSTESTCLPLGQKRSAPPRCDIYSNGERKTERERRLRKTRVVDPQLIPRPTVNLPGDYISPPAADKLHFVRSVWIFSCPLSAVTPHWEVTFEVAGAGSSYLDPSPLYVSVCVSAVDHLIWYWCSCLSPHEGVATTYKFLNQFLSFFSRIFLLIWVKGPTLFPL